MGKSDIKNYIEKVLKNIPSDWLNLTTHRLDIYEEKLAKKQFLEHFESLFQKDHAEKTALSNLPTAYDYIRLGHPLSCVLEWTIAKSNSLPPDNVISFSSRTTPILAVLRKNLLKNKKTRILYTDTLPDFFDAEAIRSVYNYNFELIKLEKESDISSFDGSTIYIAQEKPIGTFNPHPNIDFHISFHTTLGSIVIVDSENSEAYIAEIQHVRRRETIAMTPANSLIALKDFLGQTTNTSITDKNTTKEQVLHSIKKISKTNADALVASSGLSMQYAIMMGLIDDALKNHKGKNIKFIVPPNCYGGTNDQARRVAACIETIEIIDLLVDGENDMVRSIDSVLEEIAKQDAIPYLIAEIPTNPRVEVPDLLELKTVLSKKRYTTAGTEAIAPVFILDQTFCPNVAFLEEGKTFSSIKTISYTSGSKFPSAGECTAGYCVSNEKANTLLSKIEKHLRICDNEATPLQYEILAKQLPSMKQRIEKAYINTQEFVDFIQDTLPEAKINFVSKALVTQGFTPSVFSLDLPTKGNSEEEREAYKRALNLRLIQKMISEIPEESKFCVSYGQLNGSYWTIPATSTQGTTKEGDKDYIVRVSISPNLDLKHHKKVFLDFVEDL